MKNCRIKVFVSILLICVILSGFWTSSIAAGEFDWANDAISALKEKGFLDSGFTASSSPMTVQAVVDILKSEFKFSDASARALLIETDMNASITRKEVCLVLAAIGSFPQGNHDFSDCSGLDPRYQKAIGALSTRNIAKGYGDGRFMPNATVNNAEFAVFLYRTINKMGGTKSALDNLKPGDYGYDEVMYLFTRKGIDSTISATAKLSSTTIKISTPGVGGTLQNRTGIQAIWTAWCDRLESLPPEATTRAGAVWSPYTDLGPDPNVIDAAVKVVREDRTYLADPDISGIFSDVEPSDWFYDGIMYLFSNGIVMGYGTGEFQPYTGVNKGTLATLIVNRIKKNNVAYGIPVLQRAIDDGYFLPDTPVTTDSVNTPVTREVMAYAAAKLYPNYQNGINVNANDILEGYTGIPTIEEYRKAVAFMVSIGAIKGDVSKNLNMQAEVTRAEMGVIFARVLIGLDKSKIKDYSDAIKAAKGVE